MKINFYDHVQGLILDVAYKTEGLAYLIRHCKPMDTSVRDGDAREGISMILEDLAKDGRNISTMLDSVCRPELDHKIEIR